MRKNFAAAALVAVLFLALIVLTFTYSAPVDSAPGQPTPVLNLFDYLPFISKAPTPTPTLRPTPAPPSPTPTPTPIPTLRPTLTNAGGG